MSIQSRALQNAHWAGKELRLSHHAFPAPSQPRSRRNRARCHSGKTSEARRREGEMLPVTDTQWVQECEVVRSDVFQGCGIKDSFTDGRAAMPATTVLLRKAMRLPSPLLLALLFCSLYKDKHPQRSPDPFSSHQNPLSYPGKHHTSVFTVPALLRCRPCANRHNLRSVYRHTPSNFMLLLDLYIA